jgi:hypothetical protein
MRTVALALLAACVLPASALAQATQPELTGTTKQKRGVTIQFSPDGRRFELFEIGWRARCRGGRRFSSISEGTREAIRRRGNRFSDRGRYSFRTRGRRASVRLRVSGRVGADGSVRGRWSVNLTLRRRGRVLDRCRTGSLTFSARPAPPA